jgi:raffinose/stachyose/melibiose transport system substrate-binding protein
VNHIMQPDTQKALKISASTVKGAEPDQKTAPLAYEWSQGPGKQPFYTVQDQAFPKQQSDQYFAVQSDILQGKVDPAGAAKRMQDVVSAWAKK